MGLRKLSVPDLHALGSGEETGQGLQTLCTDVLHLSQLE